MGYYVEIVNSDNVLNTKKVLYSVDTVTTILKKFDFFNKKVEADTILFCHSNNDKFVLFYDKKSFKLWANTTSDELILIMIEIAKSFNDGSRVIGDNLETYLSIDKTFIHNDDKQKVTKYKQGYNKIGLLILFTFFVIQFFI